MFFVSVWCLVSGVWCQSTASVACQCNNTPLVEWAPHIEEIISRCTTHLFPDVVNLRMTHLGHFGMTFLESTIGICMKGFEIECKQI